MTVDAIFAQALARSTSAERTAYLDEACGQDVALRQRVETLLQAHEAAGDFLGKPAIQCAAEELAAEARAGDTQDDLRSNDRGVEALEFLAPSDRPASLGRVGHYEIQEVIGHGGMGIVLRAFDEQLHRVVAIKVMAAQLATNATARRRFAREAQAAAAVSHDHIVTIHAVEESSSVPYLVMQFVAGLSLQQRLDRDGPLDLQEILRIGMQTAAGLAAAHAQGLVHRDIKPANILLENGVERVKVTDFGLARAFAEASLTQSGVVTGTPQFMSPEQARGDPVDQCTDLFSLGSVLYAMCTGRAPFRGRNTMSVLKRVCEETPPPIRETNPEIPDWLIAIIDKLQSKDPAERYQSAAEVAALLARHLAHVQHPSVAPLPVAGPGKPPASRRRRRIVTAVALVCLAGVAVALGAALLGIFDPEGTQNGPEGKAPPSETAAKPDPHPFVLLGGQGVAERKFDTLAEAVQGASDGDTIEIRGNGPFVSAPINLGKQALTIRACEGFRPVVRLGSEGKQAELSLLMAYGPLVLEGIEWQHPGGPHDNPRMESIVWTRGFALHIANCRFVMAPGAGQRCVYSEAPVGSFRNCEFLSLGRGVWGLQPSNSVQVMDNCLHLGAVCLQNGYAGSHSATASIRLTRNTFVTNQVAVGIEAFVLPEPSGTAPSPIRMDVSSTIFDGPSALCVAMPGKVLSEETLVKPGYVEGHLRRMLVWRDQENLYAGTGPAILFWALDRENSAPGVPRSLAEWKRFWGSSDADCAEGRVRYQGGNLFARLAESPDQLRPADFRLRPDSAGYRAGKDGKDLGADVDLLGPGPAYERWKKTPEYQEWLKETKKVTKAEASTAEPKAFVVLTGKGVEVRRYDTLAEAVQGASDGATIEIRGNGPFVSGPIKITQALTIRAGAGFRPVIQFSLDGLKSEAPLLETNSLLVLEGLEFQRLSEKREDAGVPHAIHLTDGASIHAAHCRFAMRNQSAYVGGNMQVAEFRNSEFLGALHYVVFYSPPSGGRLTMANCIHSAGIGSLVWNPEVGEATVRFTQTTTVGHYALIANLSGLPKAPRKDPIAKPLRTEASGNVFECAWGVWGINLTPLVLEETGVLDAAGLEAVVGRLLAWQGRDNLYPADVRLLVASYAGAEHPLKRDFKGLAAWKEFWDSVETGSAQGSPGFKGGDVRAKLALTPELVTPDDFRLLPDSPGYRAGKDGRDLGVDIDLVGPGPAYERWKKTPEYQQWLKDTVQVKK